MKVVFFAAGTFGLSSLEKLKNSSHEILGVVTSADKPIGRGRKVAESPIKLKAHELDLPVLDIEKVNAAESLEKLSQMGADVFCVVSFGVLLSDDFINLPPQGCVNVHPSLLPKYRGASPIAQAIINGESVVGTSTMRIKQELDAGDVLLQKECNLKGDENAKDVWDLLSDVSADLLVETLDGLEKNEVKPRPQDDSQATHCHKFKKEDAKLDWSLSSEEIHNRVRGFYMWPNAFTYYQNSRIKILKTQLGSSDSSGGKPGEVVELDKTQGIGVRTSSGVLFVQELQPEGKKPMTHLAFLNGHPLKSGDILG